MKVTIESNFLKPNEDVQDQDIITFLNEGEEIPDKKFGGTRFVIKVRTPKGAEKTAGVNNTSKFNLIEAYGEDSLMWIGKQARVHIFKDFKDGKQIFKTYFTHPNKDMEGKDINQ